ncbi:MAG: hypothetical protein ACTSYX_05570 [Candidatus Thorarchaeota archaeon]
MTDLRRVKDVMSKPATPESMREAAEAFREYLTTRQNRSRPMLVSLGYRKKYPKAIDINKIPEEIERNPDFYEHMRKIVSAR